MMKISHEEWREITLTRCYRNMFLKLLGIKREITIVVETEHFTQTQIYKNGSLIRLTNKYKPPYPDGNITIIGGQKGKSGIGGEVIIVGKEF